MDIEDVKRFSIELAQVMDDIGLNEEMIYLRRHVKLLMDTIDSIHCNRTPSNHSNIHLYKTFTFGSQIEGSTTIGMMSDTDKLVCSESFLACERLSDCQDSKTNYYVLREPLSLPQCCCLQFVVGFENNIFVLMSRDLISVSEISGDGYIIDKEGRLLLNSKFYLNVLLQNINNSGLFRAHQHGPALHSCNNQDNVLALQCLTLPDNCRFLFKRPRPGHWPSKETLLKAEQCGVFLVPPGLQGHIFGYDDARQFSFIQLQYENKYVDSQFRMSTNMTERLLMFDLNIVQMKAYVITKMIRKEFLQPLVDERLSTFHVKTALLFTIEHCPEYIWRDDNLVHCVIYCLNTLNRFLKRGYCPHYTISSVNLFQGKLTTNELQILNETVTKMITSYLQCLRKLCMDDVGCRLAACSLGVRNGNYLSGADIRVTIIIQMINNLRPNHRSTFSVVNYLDMELTRIKSAMTTYNEYKNELEFMFQNICSILASQRASDCIAEGTEVTSDIIAMYETSLGSTDITNHVRYASMLVCTRQFERADEVIQTIQNMITSDMINITELSEQRIYFKPKQDQRSNKCTSTEILMEYTSKIIFPLVFVRSEINCVPYHLIYEKYRAITEDEIKSTEIEFAGNNMLNRTANHVFESDVNAFIYYLQYTVSKNREKKQLAFKNLKDYCESELQKRTSYYEATALNMLGHIFELENSFPDAWKAYSISVTRKPRYNAAYWHLFRLLGQVIGC